MKRKNMVVGMKVLAKSHEDLTDAEVEKGTEGVVCFLEPWDYTGDYVVRVDFGGCPLWLTADAIKPAEKPAKKPLKVGDKVMARKADRWGEGTELTVTSVDESDPVLPYLVGKDGRIGEASMWYSRANLRRVKNK